jgi:RecB family exonuclease
LIHAALARSEGEIIGTGLTHATLERAQECLDEVWQEADFGTPELTMAWLGKARHTIVKLYDNWPTTAGEPIELEHEVRRVIEDVTWIGFVDRVETSPDGLRIIDYKTSTTAVSEVEAAESVQLAFYASALETEGRHVADAQLWYPRTGTKSLTTRALDLSRLDELSTEMAAITTAIRDEDWRPRPGSHCDRCGFRLSCPAWPETADAFLP